MTMIKRASTAASQRGFTFWEMAVYIFAIGFVLACALKLAPNYADDHNVATAMQGLHEAFADKDVYDVSNTEIKGRLSKFFQVSMIPDDILDDLEVERDGGHLWVRLNYEVRVPFMGNIDVVMRFEHEIDLSEPVPR